MHLVSFWLGHSNNFAAPPPYKSSGNALQALVALGRLGVKGALVTKLGDDSIGQQIRAVLSNEPLIDTSLIKIEPHTNSPFSYIIVDAQTQTRHVSDSTV